MKKIMGFHLFASLLLGFFGHCFAWGISKDTVYENGYFDGAFRDTVLFVNDSPSDTIKTCSLSVIVEPGKRSSFGIVLSRKHSSHLANISSGHVAFWMPSIPVWATNPLTEDAFTNFQLDGPVLYPTKLQRGGSVSVPETIAVRIIFHTANSLTDTLTLIGKYTGSSISGPSNPSISLPKRTPQYAPVVREQTYSVLGRRCMLEQDARSTGIYFGVSDKKVLFRRN